jgi:hypothetical protein
VPSLRVASIVGPNVVTVEVNQYTAATDPRTGDAQTDIASGARVYFSAGDAVRCVKAGQWASATSRSIVSIVGQTVTLDGAHNLAIGDDIEHTRFALVDSGVQKFAYLGRTDGTIEGTDPARDIG